MIIGKNRKIIVKDESGMEYSIRRGHRTWLLNSALCMGEIDLKTDNLDEAVELAKETVHRIMGCEACGLLSFAG